MDSVGALGAWSPPAPAKPPPRSTLAARWGIPRHLLHTSLSSLLPFIESCQPSQGWIFLLLPYSTHHVTKTFSRQQILNFFLHVSHKAGNPTCQIFQTTSSGTIVHKESMFASFVANKNKINSSHAYNLYLWSFLGCFYVFQAIPLTPG